jgi:hypothetical protein
MEMSDMFEIVLEPSLFQWEKKRVTGPICIKIGPHVYPSESWEDYPLQLLWYWISDWEQVLANKKRKAMFPFISGPFQINIVVKGDVASCAFRDERLNPQIWEKVYISSNVLTVGLVGTIQRIIPFCYQHSHLDIARSFEGIVKKNSFLARGPQQI